MAFTYKHDADNWKSTLINSIAFNGGWIIEDSNGIRTATVWVSHRLGKQLNVFGLNVDIAYLAPWDNTEMIKELCLDS